MVRKIKSSQARGLARRAALLMSGMALASAALAGSAQAADSYTPPPLEIANLEAPFLDAGDNEVTTAGSHPFKIRNRIDVKLTSFNAPIGSLREVAIDMPVGFVGDPSEFPTCTTFELLRLACPPASQIGQFSIYTNGMPYGPAAVYNMDVPNGQAARFGSTVLGGAAAVFFQASVRPEDNGITVRVTDIPQLLPIDSTELELWGVPADSAHNAKRVPDMMFAPGPGGPAGVSPTPFLTLPTDCSKPMVTRLRASSWQYPDQWVERTYAAPAATDCDDLSFEPNVKVQPEHTVAGQPAGYTVELSQKLNDNPDSKATAHLKDATIALPEGVTINPGVADGLEACSEAQFGRGKDGAPSCPSASKIGEVTIDTPVLDEPLTGDVYQAAQNANPFGSTLAIYMAPKSDRYGVTMKLAGEVKTDPVTGRVTTTFLDNPQQPFSKLTLKLTGGDRAVLVNPVTCGAKTTDWSVSSWANPNGPVTGIDAFTIDHAPAGSSCGYDLFAPAFAAGSSTAIAGKSGGFAMTFARGDGQQNLSTIDVKLPEGLLGHVGQVPQCASAHADMGACGLESRIGEVIAQVGSGPSPLVVPQAGKAPTNVFLAGPYKGAPFSLSLQVPAQAGPLNLGTVVARVALFVDPKDASITARLMESRVFDHAGRLQQTIPMGLPQAVEGIPLPYRALTVNIDRPGFMVNPTSCEPTAVHAAIGSITGNVINRAARFQVGECASLGLDPKLSMTFTGTSEMKQGKHPGVEANLGTISGDANLKQVKATLPLAVALDPNNAKALCEPADAEANRCPAESIIGDASATTPVLGVPVSGPVYFVKGFRTGSRGQQIATLPKLYMTLSGQGVNINVWADSSVSGPVGKQRLETTFKDVPDVPISDFTLRINSGANGILKATADVCGAPKDTGLEFTGHNGKVKRTKIRAATSGCKPQIVSSSATRRAVSVRVGGIGAGRLTVKGARVRTKTRTIRSADAATIKTHLSLTSAQRSRLAQGRSVRVAVRVSFKPTKGKTVNLRRNVTVEGVKRD